MTMPDKEVIVFPVDEDGDKREELRYPTEGEDVELSKNW